MMRITVRGTKYEFDPERLPLVEARLLKKYAKLGAGEFYQGLKTGDPDAVAGLVFLAKFRAGEQPKWGDLDDLDLIADINVERDEDEGDEDDDEGSDDGGSPDPT